MTPLEAVTAADPYPYYASLISDKPLYFDESLKMWVASSAHLVKDALSDARFKVRPGADPVPSALRELRNGAVFGSLMRMTDGAKHCPLKSAALDAINEDCAKECGRLAFGFATTLRDRSTGGSPLDLVRRLMFLLPTCTMGSCLGVSPEELDPLTVEVSAFVTGISPLATSEQRTLGDCAAQSLSDRIGRLIDHQVQSGILLRSFFAAGTEQSIDRTAIVRNLIGFLFQTYDATAGLIGNSLRLLARNDALHRRLQAGQAPLRPFVWEVMRFDPPVQNTRRFAMEDIRLGDLTIRAGEQVLLILAAANRDPSEFPIPDRFDLDRAGPAAFGFGLDKHECPGKPLALEMTCAALRVLLTSSFPLRDIPEKVTYRPSANTRIPLY
jgi:cytochrome P450